MNAGPGHDARRDAHVFVVFNAPVAFGDATTNGSAREFVTRDAR